jgi:cell division inhibitor SulA
MRSFSDEALAMHKFLIKRETPGTEKMPPEDLRGAAQKSCEVLDTLGPQIRWAQSYVTGGTIHCVYIAPSEDLIREHAQRAGFPANEIMEVKAIIDPTTAEV